MGALGEVTSVWAVRLPCTSRQGKPDGLCEAGAYQSLSRRGSRRHFWLSQSTQSLGLAQPAVLRPQPRQFLTPALDRLLAAAAGTAGLLAGRWPRGLRQPGREGPPPAPAQRAHPRRRGRHANSHAAGPLPPRVRTVPGAVCPTRRRRGRPARRPAPRRAGPIRATPALLDQQVRDGSRERADSAGSRVLLTTVLGGLLGSFFQQRTWAHQHRVQTQDRERERAVPVFEEVSRLLGLPALASSQAARTRRPRSPSPRRRRPPTPAASPRQPRRPGARTHEARVLKYVLNRQLNLY